MQRPLLALDDFAVAVYWVANEISMNGEWNPPFNAMQFCGALGGRTASHPTSWPITY